MHFTQSKLVGGDDSHQMILVVFDEALLESRQPLFKLAVMPNFASAYEMPPISVPSQMVNLLMKF